MPIEIKELHIRVAVRAEPDAVAALPAAHAGGDIQDGDREAIVAECVEQVLRIIQEKAER